MEVVSLTVYNHRFVVFKDVNAWTVKGFVDTTVQWANQWSMTCCHSSVKGRWSMTSFLSQLSKWVGEAWYRRSVSEFEAFLSRFSEQVSEPWHICCHNSVITNMFVVTVQWASRWSMTRASWWSRLRLCLRRTETCSVPTITASMTRRLTLNLSSVSSTRFTQAHRKVGSFDFISLLAGHLLFAQFYLDPEKYLIGHVSLACENEAGGSLGQEVHILHVNI